MKRFFFSVCAIVCGAAFACSDPLGNSSSVMISTSATSSGSGDPSGCVRSPQDDTICLAELSKAFSCPSFSDPESVGLGPACVEKGGNQTGDQPGTWCCPDEPIVGSCQRWPSAHWDALCKDQYTDKTKMYDCWWLDPKEPSCCIKGIDESCCPPAPAPGCQDFGSEGCAMAKCVHYWCCP